MNAWHPILAAVEVEVGVWLLTSQRGPYAIVRVLEIGGEHGYRAVTYREPRQLVGYYRTLHAACAAAHLAYVSAHAPASSGYPATSHTGR